MSPDAAYASIDAAALPHLHGHSCTDGRWYNENAGSRSACPTLTHLRHARAQVGLLDSQVHRAAHDDAAVRATAEGMTGLVMADLGGDDREGWMQTARDAIEALAAHLDPTTRQEAPDEH